MGKLPNFLIMVMFNLKCNCGVYRVPLCTVQWKKPQFKLFPASACLIARALDVIQGLEV